MTFPFRRKIQFYSSKTKIQLMEEVQNLLNGKKYKKAEGETVTGNFVIRTTNRFLFFDIVFCGDIYEFEGKTFVILFAKMRMLFEILLLLAIGTAAAGFLNIFSEEGLIAVYAISFIILLCGLFWAINYLQFLPALNSVKSKLE